MLIEIILTFIFIIAVLVVISKENNSSVGSASYVFIIVPLIGSILSTLTYKFLESKKA